MPDHPHPVRRRRACYRKHDLVQAALAVLLILASGAAAAEPVERPDRSGQLAGVPLPPRRPAGLRHLPRRLGAEMGLGRRGLQAEGRGRTALGPRPLRRQQGQGRGDRRPFRGLAAGRPAGRLPLRPGVGPGRAPHHADRRRQLRAARQPGDAHPDPRRGQADQARPARARHPLRAGRVARPISPSTRAARSRCRSTLRAPSASTTACAWCWRPTCSARASAA